MHSVRRGCYGTYSRASLSCSCPRPKSEQVVGILFGLKEEIAMACGNDICSHKSDDDDALSQPRYQREWCGAWCLLIRQFGEVH